MYKETKTVNFFTTKITGPLYQIIILGMLAFYGVAAVTISFIRVITE